MESGIVLTTTAIWYIVGMDVSVVLVQYPSFGIADEARWSDSHRHHISRITRAVSAPWAAQAHGLGWWLVRGPRRPSTTW